METFNSLYISDIESLENTTSTTIPSIDYLTIENTEKTITNKPFAVESVDNIQIVTTTNNTSVIELVPNVIDYPSISTENSVTNAVPSVKEIIQDSILAEIAPKLTTRITGIDLNFDKNTLITTRIETGKLKGTEEIPSVSYPLTKREDVSTKDTPMLSMLNAKADFWSNLAYPHFIITYPQALENSSSLFDDISEDQKDSKLSMKMLDIPLMIRDLAYDTEDLGVNYFNAPTRSVAFSTGKSQMSGESSFNISLDNQLHLLSWIYGTMGDYRFGGSFFTGTKNALYKGGGLALNTGSPYRLHLIVNLLGQNTDNVDSIPKALTNEISNTTAFMIYEDIRLLGSDSTLTFGNNKVSDKTLVNVGFTYAFKYTHTITQ